MGKWLKQAKVVLVTALTIALVLLAAHPPALAGSKADVATARLGDATEEQLLAASSETPLTIFPQDTLRWAAAAGAAFLVFQCALAGCEAEQDASLLTDAEIAALLEEHSSSANSSH